MNPDGVYLGNYRGNLLGIDLNRIWDNCSSYSHPTAHAIKKLIESLSRSENPLDFVLDIHVSNTMLGFFVVGNAYDRFENYTQTEFKFGRVLLLAFSEMRDTSCSRRCWLRIPRTSVTRIQCITRSVENNNSTNVGVMSQNEDKIITQSQWKYNSAIRGRVI